MDHDPLDDRERGNMSIEELTERFYLVRGQRNKLLWCCQKALAAYDSAQKTGKGSWSAQDINEMKSAVAECQPLQPFEAT